MDITLRDRFVELWKKYFGPAELPLAIFYADEAGALEVAPAASGRRCLIGDLVKVRQGKPLCLSAQGVGCPGGKRYLGFSDQLMPNFEYFLSYGIPGKLEGERYKKTPELVREAMSRQKPFKAPAQYFIAKRWDQLAAGDNPAVVVFFASPDVLSGLFTLANFDEVDPYGVVAPFGAGCGTIVQYPYLENESDHPRCVLGTFDVSARPFVPADVLSFSVPMRKFAAMIAHMEESFLTTHSWSLVNRRIQKGPHENRER